MEIEIIDNSPKVKEELEAAVLRALEACGQTAEGYAKLLCEGFKHPTGNLKNSIAHQVQPSEKAVYVGTNSEYGIYVELGTGRYYPGGRRGWWVYVEGSPAKKKGKVSMKTYTFDEAKRVMAILRSKGLDAHMTEGQPPHPYIKPAVADHVQEYKSLIERTLKG